MNSKKSLQEAFRNATFDPRKPGTITTIVSCEDVDYLSKRAQEMLRDADRFEGFEKFCRMRDAVSVIAYAMTLLPRQAPQEPG